MFQVLSRWKADFLAHVSEIFDEVYMHARIHSSLGCLTYWLEVG